jgi:predicted phosphodiesterase
MKICITSDNHLDKADYDLKNTENAKVLIMAGDMMEASDLKKYPPETYDLDYIQKPHGIERAMRYRGFLERVSDQFEHVIYVMGNHEHWNGKLDHSYDILHDECSKFSNIHLLEKQVKIIDDITFVGTTLWTDARKRDPMVMWDIGREMKDYTRIKIGSKPSRKLWVADTVNEHEKSMKFIKDYVQSHIDERIVMVTHHCPSLRSIAPYYRAGNGLCNYAYVTDLDDFILDHPRIEMWISGHVHEHFDYHIGNARIIHHARGYYGYEAQANDYTPKFVDLDAVAPKVID